MGGFYLLVPALLTIFISFLVVRAGAIALMLTGMDRKRAVFQALSAFSGTGFTTKEAERVVNHPARRKTVSLLMILGNAGIVTVIITATSSLVTSRGYDFAFGALTLIVGAGVIYGISSSKGLMRRWERFIENRLVKMEAFEEDAVEDLLHLIEGYGLVRAIIKDDSHLAGNTISFCRACGDQILVLGVERGREWFPIPPEDMTIEAGDRVVVYGHHGQLMSLFEKEEEKT